LQIEFLVIHSFVFLGLVALAKSDTRKETIIQWSVCSVFLTGYLAFAARAGWSGVGAFLGATAATYLGFLLNLTAPGRGLQLGLRWVVSFVAFMIGSGIADLPEDVGTWDRDPDTIFLGMIYFSTLGVFELSGLYRTPWFNRAESTEQSHRNVRWKKIKPG
jgi:hypothetical protein